MVGLQAVTGRLGGIGIGEKGRTWIEALWSSAGRASAWTEIAKPCMLPRACLRSTTLLPEAQNRPSGCTEDQTQRAGPFPLRRLAPAGGWPSPSTMSTKSTLSTKSIAPSCYRAFNSILVKTAAYEQKMQATATIRRNSSAAFVSATHRNWSKIAQKDQAGDCVAR
jgi:hypothetical protein